MDDFKYLKKLTEKEFYSLLVLFISYLNSEAIEESYAYEYFKNNNMIVKTNENSKIISVYCGDNFDMMYIKNDYEAEIIGNQEIYDCSFIMQKFLSNKFGDYYTNHLYYKRMADALKEKEKIERE